MTRALVLLSGGLDSSANLVLKAAFTPVAALTIDYGQRGARRELEQAAKLASHFGVEHFQYQLPDFDRLAGKGSALIGNKAIPSPTSLDDRAVTTKSAAQVWVPNRNGVLISLAASLAETKGWDAVAVGFNAEEAATFPDNTSEFMRSMTAALHFSTANHVQVVSATDRLTKPEIVTSLAALNFPFEWIWACYLGGETHCGRCESCLRLARAVREGLAGEQRRLVFKNLFGKEE